ncbi:MAG: helix-turn-helix transcriptional regulator [Rhodospirillales bacterium]|jgi:HTH-type transcriptional regulator/antitoxin HipB|nr:helix-turn-helix transcriptional regulator [Rhodospirillales bacterium]
MDYPIRFPDQIRQQLRALRKTKGLTQTQLGKLLGIGQVRIAEIERDPSVVSAAQLFRLLTALDAHIVLRDSRADDATKPDTTPKGSW